MIHERSTQVVKFMKLLTTSPLRVLPIFLYLKQNKVKLSTTYLLRQIKNKTDRTHHTMATISDGSWIGNSIILVYQI